MKRYIFLICSLLAIALAGCDEGSGTPASEIPRNTAAIENVSVGGSISPEDISWVRARFQKASLNILWGDGHFAKNADEKNYELAIAACVMSQAVETSKDDAHTLFETLKFDKIEHSDNYDQNFEVDSPAYTIGFKTLKDGQTLVAVAIRGTTDAGDIGTDLGSFFTGFRASGQNIVNDLNGYIKEYDRDKLVFLITGHSYGGATANRVAQELNHQFSPAKTYVYTFAAPFGDVDDGNYENVFNFINEDDWVPTTTFNPFKGRVGTDIPFTLGGEPDLTIYQTMTGRRILPHRITAILPNVPDVFNEYGNHNLYTYMTGLLRNNYSEYGRNWRLYLPGSTPEKETPTTAIAPQPDIEDNRPQDLGNSTASALDGTWVSNDIFHQIWIFNGNRVTLTVSGIQANGTFTISGKTLVITYSLFGTENVWPIDYELRGNSLYVSGTEFVRQ